MAKRKKPEIAFGNYIISPPDSYSGIRTIEVHFVTRDDEDKWATSGDIRDLTIRAQWNKGGETGVYGFAIEYRNVYAVNLGHAERMVTFLRRIDKEFHKRTEQFGYVRTFGDYLRRIASVLNIKRAVEWNSVEQRQKTMPNVDYFGKMEREIRATMDEEHHDKPI